MFETNEIDLVKRLNRFSPDLAARIRRLEKIVGPLLSRIYSIFPAYTDHDKSHSQHVMTILSWLLPANMVDPLSAQELFYLEAAALLHDIGMLEAVEKVGNLEAQKEIRDSHHLRSERYVIENYERLGLDISDAYAIGEVCRSHRKVNIVEDVGDIPGPQGRPIRMQLLCAAIRIADELHLTADRAPQIVLDAIRPPQDSISHFEKHLSISGVGPLDSSEGTIQISATVQTLALEQALRQMEREIQEKLTEVVPIFIQHNLPWKTIKLDLRRRKVVERKVILHLARFGESREDELAAKLDESPGAIESSLEDLAQWHSIEPGENSAYVRLAADSNTFEEWLRQFLRTEEEIEFVMSPYVRRCIEEFAFDDFRQQFGAFYDLQEKEDRILVLQNAPTALYLLLFVSEFQVEPAIMPKRSVLDMAMLLGFLTDVFRFPQIAQIKGIESAVMAIQSKIGEESRSLLRLLKALGPDLGRDVQDVFNELVPTPELIDTDSEDRIEFSLTVSHPRLSVERGMTFPHLLKASMISGEKLELVGDKVQLSSEDHRMSQAISSPPDYVVITPHRPKLSPLSGVMLCRVELDHARKRITLFADAERSADYSKYPIIVRMTMRPDRKNATFSPSVYPTNVDVQQALEIDEMFRWFKSGDFHRLVIELDQTELLPSGVTPSVLEALGLDLKDGTFEPFVAEPYRDVLRCLAQLQHKIDERIPFPIMLTSQQVVAIVELAKASNDMSVTRIRDELLLIAGESKSDWTTVRISTYFPNGQIESDEFLGPFARIIPKIELKQEEKNQELAEALQAGDIPIRITHGSALNMAEFRQRIIEGFSESEERSFLPGEPESEQPVQTVCQVAIQPIQDKMWYREQVFHYETRDVSTANRIFSNAKHLLEQGQTKDAIDELTDGLRRFPDDALLAGLLGWAYYKDAELESAYKHSLEAVNLQDTKWAVPVSFAYYNLGLCSLLLDRLEEGMSWYEKAVKMDTGPVLDESIEDLKAIVTAEKPEVLYALAFLYGHKRDSAKAIESYEQYLDSNSQYDEYRELARAAIKRLGQSKQTH